MLLYLVRLICQYNAQRKFEELSSPSELVSDDWVIEKLLTLILG